MRVRHLGLALFFGLCSAVRPAWSQTSDHSGHGTSAPAKGDSSSANNALKSEMQLLRQAFVNLIDSLVLNELAAIEGPFHQVHKAKTATHAAIHASKIKLPRNNDKLKQFVEADEKFHKSLEELLEASRKSDKKKVLAVTHGLLDQCVQCHDQYR